MVRTRGNSRAGSTHSSRPASPHRQQRELELSQIQSTLTQLTAAVRLMTETQMGRQQAPSGPVGPPPDPNFDWNKLLLPALTTFPPASEGQVQQLAEALLSRVESLKGRNHHEVRFVLSMASQYPHLTVEAQNVLYQRLNFYYIMVYHGWGAAISAAESSASNSLAVLPQGFVIHQSSPRNTKKENKSMNISFD